VEVPTSEDLASHIVPESCGAHREVRVEALTGVLIGQPLSRESKFNQGADAVNIVEGHMGSDAIASHFLSLRGPRPWHVNTLLVWEPGDLTTGRVRFHDRASVRIGKMLSRIR
jgi:hypothetical protein